jgi:hypothetical protein
MEQSVTITNIVTTWYKQSYKQDLFPQYLKKNRYLILKKMKEIIELVKRDISLTDNKVLIEKIKLLANKFEIVKQ